MKVYAVSSKDLLLTEWREMTLHRNQNDFAWSKTVQDVQDVQDGYKPKQEQMIFSPRHTPGRRPPVPGPPVRPPALRALAPRGSPAPGTAPRPPAPASLPMAPAPGPRLQPRPPRLPALVLSPVPRPKPRLRAPQIFCDSQPWRPGALAPWHPAIAEASEETISTDESTAKSLYLLTITSSALFYLPGGSEHLPGIPWAPLAAEGPVGSLGDCDRGRKPSGERKRQSC